MDGTLKRYEECDEYWKISGLNLSTQVLTAASTQFVSLIVLLRLLMVRRPMSFERLHEAISRIGCKIVWAFSLLIPTITFVVSFYDQYIFSTIVAIQAQGLCTVPILLTIVMYGILICSLEPQTGAADATAIRMAALVKMTHGIVIGLIVCNVPGIAFVAYLSTMQKQGKLDAVFQSDTAVRIISSVPILNCKCL